MDRYIVTIIPSSMRTRVLLTHGPDELLRANLPPPSSIHYEQATSRVLEGLSLWLDQKLHVVLSVDEKDVSLCLGLTDEMGIGHHRVYYEVAVAMRHVRPRRGIRIRGIGNFAELRQLAVRGTGDIR